MSNKSDKPQNPAEIAREAFRQLAVRRITPTPDAYRTIYDELAGTPPKVGADTLLLAAAEQLAANGPRELADFSLRLQRAAKAGDWTDFGRLLTTQLTEQHTALTTANARPAAMPATSVTPAPAPVIGIATAGDANPEDVLRDLLSRSLSLAVASLLRDNPPLLREAETLADDVREAKTPAALEEVAGRLKQLCFKIEMKAGDMSEQQELLLRLFKLLLENIGELQEDDSWLRGQLDTVQNLLSGQINHAVLEDATRSLKEVIYKQGLLKHSLGEAKARMKSMMITFIDRLSAIANTTGDYHDKMTGYATKISEARDIVSLSGIIDDVMRDTRYAQAEALRSRDDMLAARKEVQEAENRIQQLETELKDMSELVREDQLTGSLNRRGLDDVLEREVARAGRRHLPLCLALLDLDDFKKLNDTHGHQAGDDVLIHLVRVVKDTLRTMDVIGRFGGEEFMILLPDTPLEEAVKTVTRVQRELTKRIFLYKNERLLITFSAGVALRGDKEDQAALVKRADDALYKAKRAGKNRVIAADPPVG
ncbi:MAG: diguanylate cyclase [Proteobacteria bacterium]|nr:diguanylate cyclase [Pseudomonadota bacterium]